MSHHSRLDKLKSLGWTQPQLPVQHRICGETVWHISGQIENVNLDAWLQESDGFVFLQIDGPDAGRDFEFEAFCEIVKNGWPKAKASEAKTKSAAAVRSLFGDEE